MTFLSRLGNFLWNPWLLCLFLLVGGYFSLRTGFFQLFGIRIWWKATVGKLFQKKRRSKGGITQFQALSTALASTIGTGSIAGVSTAIFYGGPGAVFWMWISAFLGMMTGCAEKTLAVQYHQRHPRGGFYGGPMFYIEKGLHHRPLALAFSLLCVAEAICGGNLVQANSISTILKANFGWNRLVIGLIIALVCGIVIWGGIQRIGAVSQLLVPVMAILFIGSGVITLAFHSDAIPDAFSQIVSCALFPKAAVGGIGGYSISTAMRYGIARGVFTNEAGLGTSAMAHAAAQVEEPAEEGMWGIFEVFFATILICSITSLVILTSGVYDPAAALSAIESGTVTDSMLGAPLSSAAFSTALGRSGAIVLSACLLLFAFTSLLGTCYYGEQGLTYLTGSNRLIPPYRVLFLILTVIGAVGDMTSIWQLTDIFNGLMALPNLAALLLLSNEAVGAIKSWVARNQ